MSERRHTPGPWTVGAVSPESEVPIIHEYPRGPYCVAVAIPAGEPDKASHLTTANAHLIAAAPDMLEALERIEPNIGWRGKPADDLDSDFFCCEFCGGQATDPTDVPHHDECLVHVIRTAISRAKGDAS